ncbi:MAG TPA: histidinol-phosphate transaminase [Bacteroidia bacterium]|nr:histidinol-phosphate transaminase [Bacteroidia bacterium]
MKNKKQQVVRLNANENFYGCSPAVLKAIKRDIKNVHIYPDLPFRLEEKLAEKFGVKQKNIVVGAGSVRLIDGIIQTFVEPDEEIIIFERSFVAYEQLAAAHRRKYLIAKQTNFICDVKNIFPLITQKTKVIFVANPNNPTGTIISHSQIENLLKNISEKILLVIDEAYCEYVTDKSFPDSISLQKEYSNLIILRTFSKIYGLAGLRIGYAIAEETIANTLKNSRIPFFFNSLSEDAALAALSDKEFITACAKKNAKEREWLYQKLKQSGINVIPSQGNFIYIYFDGDDEKEKMFERFRHEGLKICNLKIFGQDKSLRIGIGNKSTNKKTVSCFFLINFIEALR